ncbi:delta-60 repeat domain-containing protein [Hymenobacter cellulosilyticus]|uniref:Delta-60 repeat domain-containing protein n=1 Tax=Hymenobacter cellulosilyticus TaxID=2932248 RepID=A0A8T9Q835_9BACT|nr:delta-60 repeat domain-containing protein [Hymenobacter cellulosilyticus]UOQ73305.1 delta-60 repeat domain-containing protein [Hymenobacter cellulosilyticus]
MLPAFLAFPNGGIVRLLPSGTLDPSFDIGTGNTSGGAVFAVLVQTDGKILLGGSFTSFNGRSANSVVRLTSTGALDPSFALNVISAGLVQVLAQQPDGKLLIGGGFVQTTGQPNPNLVRLLPDGNVDNTFQTGSGPSDFVRTLLVDNAGRILVGGHFTRVNGVARNRFARLMPDGSLDATLGAGAGANSLVLALGQTATGQVLAAGSFTQYDGVAAAEIVRLDASTGTRDAGFAPRIEPRGFINQVVPTINSQLLVSGSFTEFNGQAAPGTQNALRRLNADGSLDPTFAPTVTGSVRNMQPDGSFYVVSINPTYAVRRLLPTGLVDNTFTMQAFGPSSGATNVILVGATGLPNGKLLVFGRFTTYGSLTGLNGLVRLNADGSPDNTFGPTGGTAARRVTQVLVQPSGKLIVVSDELSAALATVVIRLNADGTPTILSPLVRPPGPGPCTGL